MFQKHQSPSPSLSRDYIRHLWSISPQSAAHPFQGLWDDLRMRCEANSGSTRDPPSTFRVQVWDPRYAAGRPNHVPSPSACRCIISNSCTSPAQAAAPPPPSPLYPSPPAPPRCSASLPTRSLWARRASPPRRTRIVYRHFLLIRPCGIGGYDPMRACSARGRTPRWRRRGSGWDQHTATVFWPS
jgi:hypothetical protein